MRSKCSVPKCDDFVRGAGLCSTHYHRVRRTGTTELAERPKSPRKTCTECHRPHHAKGLCASHYATAQRAANPKPPKPRKPRVVKRCGDCGKSHYSKTPCVPGTGFKVCTRCGILRSTGEFRWTSSGIHRYRRSVCAVCDRLKDKRRYNPALKTEAVPGLQRKRLEADAFHEYSFARSVLGLGADKALRWVADGLDGVSIDSLREWGMHEREPDWQM